MNNLRNSILKTHNYVFSLLQISLFCKEIVLHFIPGHSGIPGNEWADVVAREAASTFSDHIQNNFNISLSNLKAYLKQKALAEWTQQMEAHLPDGHRYSLLTNKPANLKLRSLSPRPFQCLFSRYRSNRVETAGQYARTLEYIIDPACRFCGYPLETIQHLLDSCPGTRQYRLEHNISSSTLTINLLASSLITQNCVFNVHGCTEGFI